MTEGLTSEETASLLVCPECGGKAHSHTDLSRATTGACSLNVMEARVAAVERIVAAHVAAALTEVVARSEAVTPRENLRGNERRTYWLGAGDVLRVVRGYRDNLTRREQP